MGYRESYNFMASLFGYIIHKIFGMNWPMSLDNAPNLGFQAFVRIGNAFVCKPFYHLLLCPTLNWICFPSTAMVGSIIHYDESVGRNVG